MRLLLEVRSDHAAFRSAVDMARTSAVTAESEAPQLAWLAWNLHHAYGAIEALLSRIFQEIEGSVPAGPQWHRDVMELAGAQMPGLRPALLSTESVRGLHRLRGFRHFVRHAYFTPLDWRHLALHRDDLLILEGSMERDLNALEAWLDALVGAAEE